MRVVHVLRPCLRQSLPGVMTSLTIRPITTGSVRYNNKAWQLPDREVMERRAEGGVVVLDVARVEREPFIKNLFKSKYDRDILAFPEVLNKKQVDELNQKLTSIGYIDGKFQSEPSLATLQEAGVFGMEVPDSHGGLSYTMTEAARLMEAVASSTHDQTLTAHTFLVQALLRRGTEEQRRKYLPALASGQMLATFCCAEPAASSDLNALQCRAVQREGDSHLTLTGVKVGVPAASSAHLLLVIAQVEESDHLGNPIPGLAALIVDRQSAGITCRSCDPGLGVDLCDVEFNNTPVPMENVLGEVGGAHSLLLEVYSHVRTMLPAQLVGQLRPLVAMTTQHCLHRPLFNKYLSDFDLTKCRVAEVNRDMYAMESLTYLTTGLVDLTKDPDYVLEAAACKVLASEAAQRITDKCLRLLGNRGYYRREEVGDTAERYLKQIRSSLRYTGSNEVLKMFITLGGLQHASALYADEVTKMRNPMLFPVHVLKRVISDLRPGRRAAGLAGNLYAYLHPSLNSQAELLEECVHVLSRSVLSALEKFGNELMDRQMPLLWLSEMASDIYVMSAVLARASRSYCIGLRHADVELTLASACVQQCADRVKGNAKLLEGSPFRSPEVFLLNCADTLLKQGGYKSAHSLDRTY